MVLPDPVSPTSASVCPRLIASEIPSTALSVARRPARPPWPVAKCLVTPTVSMIYLVAVTKKPTTKAKLNAILKREAEGSLKNYVQYTDEELVSSDFKRNPHSSIIDSKLTNANGDLIQIGAWYDNEWGYSCRLADLTAKVLGSLPA